MLRKLWLGESNTLSHLCPTCLRDPEFLAYGSLALALTQGKSVLWASVFLAVK